MLAFKFPLPNACTHSIEEIIVENDSKLIQSWVAFVFDLIKYFISPDIFLLLKETRSNQTDVLGLGLAELARSLSESYQFELALAENELVENRVTRAFELFRLGSIAGALSSLSQNDLEFFENFALVQVLIVLNLGKQISELFEPKTSFPTRRSVLTSSISVLR